MRHEYSLAHLTVLSLTPPQLVDVAARTGYEYVGVRITRVTPREVLYDLARDRALMRETKARLADTGIAVLDVELFRMDPALEPEHFAPELDAAAELGREAHHRATAGSRSRARDGRASRVSAISRKPLRNLREPRIPALDGDRAISPRRRASCAPSTGANAGILVDMLHFGRSHSSVDELRSCRANGSASRTSATRRRKCRRRWRDHPHRARRAAVSGRGRHPRARHPRPHAAGHSVCARDSARGAHQGRRPRGGRAACARVANSHLDDTDEALDPQYDRGALASVPAR